MMDASVMVGVAQAVDLPEGLDAFCRREHPRLVGALSLYCGDASLAEELAQDALERACEQWGRVSAMPAPGAWVHRVAMNMAHSRFRRRAAERRAHARSVAADVHEDTDVASAVALRNEVATLPRRQRGVIVMRYYLGMDVAQTAAALHMSPAAVKAAAHRAMQQLRAEFVVPDREDVSDAH
jgi:RNA polymerase sigma-70 factor (ECF subfamily)